MGGHVPFEVDGSKAVKIGENNFLVVRVQTLDRQGKIQDHNRGGTGAGRALPARSLRRHHRDVELYMVGKAGIRSVNCFPDFEADRMTIETKFWNPKNFQAELVFDITSPDGDTGTVTRSVKLEKENGSFASRSRWKTARSGICTSLCSTRSKSPWRFLHGGHAFRHAQCGCGEGLLQAQPSSRQDQGRHLSWFFPFLHGTPPSDFELKKELVTIKESGFKPVALRRAPFPRKVLDICR